MFLEYIINIFNIIYGLYQSNIFIKISVVVMLICIIYLTRNYLVNTAVYIAKKIIFRSNIDRINNSAINKLKAPLRLLVTVVLMYLVIVNFLNLDVGVLVFLNRTLKSLIAVSIFWSLYRIDTFVIHLFYKGYSRISDNENDLLIPFFRNMYKILIGIIGIIIVVEQWYNIGVILTGLGIGGLAFALAAKDTAANLFGSIMIILDRTFKIGDYIQTKHGEGIIEDIGFRSTRIRTLEETVIMIPNSIMSNEEIINCSKREKRRVKFILGITYSATSSQIEVITNEIKEILLTDNEVENNDFYVAFTTFGDSALEILVQYYTTTSNYGEYLSIQEKINIKIMDALNKNKLSVAFPSTSIYVENVGEITKR
ncbi:MAG: hypothetical protein A2Y24_09035 [Clostridiales bacterium GWE2_32_10]|nr:MAG: hypothetical protein A2Y24_09035 [Clostridiales bacterium GWE2_32_10]HBY20691.1 hypothetical protein [Clostridiales bacterium]